jgi:hypothetical protein
MMEAQLPLMKEHLPGLSEFIDGLAHQIEAGTLKDGERLERLIFDFYTVDQMEAIEVAAPGWNEMAAYAEGATLVHVTQALVALQRLPEYRSAAPGLRAMMEWGVLLHDLGKQVVKGQRDALHAFRSATLAARALPGVGFPVTRAYEYSIDPWVGLVLGASIAAPDGGLIQDNQAIPEILEGCERLFGTGTPADLIVQAILLHQSLTVVPEWPNPASLSEAEFVRCLRTAVVPLLEAVMLVDSDAWQLFDPASKEKFRQSTLAVFSEVRRVVGARQ